MLALLALAFAPPSISAPVVPPGSRREFQLDVLAVEDALEKRDFADAKRALSQLPVPDLKLEYDDSGVPKGLRSAFEDQRDTALSYWSKLSFGFSHAIVRSGGQVRIRFVKSLPVNPQSGLPATEELRFSNEPEHPKLEVLIALSRGEPLQATRPPEVHNDIARAIGAYYGLADSPYDGSYMSHHDDPTPNATRITGYEGTTLSAHLRVVDALKNFVAKQVPVRASRPKADVSPKSVTAGATVQGDGYNFAITIRNEGNAPLAYRIFPDCVCTIVEPAIDIPPNGQRIVHARMDTSQGVGEVKHRLAVLTNDIDLPLLVIPFTAQVKPRYRLLFDAPSTVMVNGPTAHLNAYLFFPNGDPLKLVAARTQGLPGTVSFREWQGFLADPEMHQAAVMREGYKLSIEVPTSSLVGRAPVVLQADIDDPVFRSIQATQVLQRGIAADPAEVYFGEVGGPARTSFLITRPGKPFKVLSAEVDSPFFSVKSITDQGPDTFKVDVTYSGAGTRGMLAAILAVRTDDPSQPVVKVPVSAEVP